MVEVDFVGARALKEILADIQRADSELYLVRASRGFLMTY
jgi:hypothetical protein